MVTVVQESLREPILSLMEVSTGESDVPCAASDREAGLRANSCDPGDVFAGRRICFPCENAYLSDLALQGLGDRCRRLLGSHGVNVQISVGRAYLIGDCEQIVKSLVPHLCGMTFNFTLNGGFGLQHFLPAAAQLERVCMLGCPDDISMLGQFYMLKELHVEGDVRHLVQLTTPLPRLHTLILRYHGTVLRKVNLQYLLPHAPALRQLVLDPVSFYGLDRRDMEVLVRLQCQQLDLLTVFTTFIDEQCVTLLARVQCPLKLEIDIYKWRYRGEPLFTLLAGLPNLVALSIVSVQDASNALWDQRGAILPYVQRLEVLDLDVPLSDSLLTLQCMLGMCPALKHLHLEGAAVSLANRIEVQAHFWHAFKSCAKLVSLRIA